jgi:uncharacterized flavoprotein (TIGR03862 family)
MHAAMEHDDRVTSEAPRTAAVVGAGPAGLMAAEILARGGVAVTVYDRMASPGRKLLLAGRGGLNLSHSEAPALFLTRYGAAADSLRPALEGFGQAAMRDWCAALGVETFVGTSGRVFPVSFKTSPLLRAWLRRLDQLGVTFAFRHRWTGWDEAGALVFGSADGERAVRADATILALGGATWPQLGSDGAWADTLAAAGVGVAPLRPANCGFAIAWSDVFREKFEGEPLKTIALSFGDVRVRGDATVTREGIEGGAVYALAAPLREAIARDGEAILHVALRPDLSHETLVARLGKRVAKQSLSNALRKTLGLAPVAVALLREAALAAGTDLGAMEPDDLARLVEAVPLRLHAPMPMARAISTAGGIGFDALDTSFMLRCRPGVFVAGEMLDWEAPTGGYLLQACFATGAAAARGALARLAGEPENPADGRAAAALALVI